MQHRDPCVSQSHCGMPKSKRRPLYAAKLTKKAAALQPRPVRAYERIRDGERQRRLITRDPRAPARHAEWGRKPTPSGLPKVSAVARAALKEARTRTLECPRCGLAVDWPACKAAANARRPAELRVGDGCLGQLCGKRNATAARRASTMRKYCGQLESGERRLVAWPDSAADTDAWLRPEGVRSRMIETLRASFGYESSGVTEMKTLA